MGPMSAPSPSRSPSGPSVSELVRLLEGRRITVLTGAGVSTESGIPDYRGPGRRRRAASPITYGEFVREPGTRARYWTRSLVGWPRMEAARPNPGHAALARLEEGGAVAGVITQNVDGLHREAGSQRVVDLHGSLARVRCLDCGRRVGRDRVQERLLELNPGWRGRLPAAARDGPDDPIGAFDDHRMAPDGDAVLPEEAARGFRVPACRRCGGVLKPDVVFFGENVPPERTEAAWALFRRGGVLLVAGSSLSVYSGLRFVHEARDAGIPVAIVNLGPTRGDEMADLRVTGRTGEVLPRLAGRLTPRRALRPRGPRGAPPRR